MVTLGTASIATGFALLLTNGIPVYGMPVGYVDGFGFGTVPLISRLAPESFRPARCSSAAVPRTKARQPSAGVI